MIELIELHKIYSSNGQTIKAVDNVNLKINQGEIFGIIGYSGAGKSSLIRCINLLEKPTSGKVYVNNQDLTELNTKQLRLARQKIGMIFQHFNLNHNKTIFENVAFALKAANKTQQEIDRRVPELLELVGLSEKKADYPSQLSGGQKQRVGIARALANNPTVLLCDEPTSALDPKTTKSILSLLKEINQKLGLTMVIITHEMEVVKEICHRVAVMQDGKIIEEGAVYDIFAHPKKSLTQNFVDSILHFELPDRLFKNRSQRGTLVKIQFKGVTAEQPIVSEILQTYKVKGNILHGKIEYIQDVPLGIFIMELTGDSLEVNKAIQSLTEKTSGLEVISYGA